MRPVPERLRWRCRRGLLELDLLLEAFLRQGYAALDTRETAAFEALLDLPDPQLLRYLLGLESPDDQGWVRVIAHIRRAALPSA
ncbi:MAG: succinate dehydrogenase assembly factor 2 [Thiohalomonadaceae bacterium]